MLQMDENLTEGNGPAVAVKDEDMEVTVTSQLEDVLVTSDNAEMVSNTQTPLEEERADAQMHSIAATVSLDTHKSGEDSEDSDSDSSSSSSSSSSFSSPSAPAAEEDDDDEGFSQPAPIKTRDEILLEELPAVEEVCITLPEEAELQPLGTVSNIIQQIVIIQSLKDTPPLNDGSIIFKSDREAAAKVFEVFGPVSSPLYVLRFNSVDQIISKGLKEGTTLYYAPAIKEYTGYILTQQLRLLQGSDASWKNDQEPPEEALDYSDDEKEQEAKRKLKNAKKKDTSHTDNRTQNPSQRQHKHDGRGFPPRHTRPSFHHQYSFRQTEPPPGHTNFPPMFIPTPCPYPPPPHHFPPSNFPLYPPPPPLPPPPPSSFFNPAFSTPFWLPNSAPFSDFPCPPPPPPPPPPQ
ncbi:H/ACA ribonucleoprotein complex non-core subunit NAF1 [Pelmatolapia mariae]|uniref:H/ACA ribonucleoprotein complex non-core subunit NAF1 n=1 Tax=Pelmatolapia mariae TaxID=158779 RepID=UPI002FE524CE